MGKERSSVANALRLFTGGIERMRGYRRIEATTAVLTAEAPIEHHRDGEPEPGVRRLEIGLLPLALPLLVPRTTVEDPKGPFVRVRGAA